MRGNFRSSYDQRIFCKNKRKEETIQSYVNWIEKFSKIKENYPEFYSLIMEIVYPDFLKETDILIEK